MRTQILILALLFGAFAEDVYICNVQLQNFCGTNNNAKDCAADPTVTLKGAPYDWSNFNMITFNDFTAGSGDVQGRLAVGGDFSASGYSVGYEIRNEGVSAIDERLPYSLVIAGNMDFRSGAVYPDGSNNPYAAFEEDILVGGTVSGLTEWDLANQRTTSGQTADDFSYAQNYYTQVSTAFGALSSNVVSGVDQTGLFTMTCSSSAMSSLVVSITVAQLNAINTYADATTCNPGAQVIFNVVGNEDVNFGGNDITYFQAENILWNFVGTGAVHANTWVNGNILAPTNTFTTSSTVHGLVIVGNAPSVDQINRVTCTPPAAVQPPVLCQSFDSNCTGLLFDLGGVSQSFRDYNVISFNNFNANTGDIEGRLAARNNVTLGNGFSIGYELQTANGGPDADLPYTLVAGGYVSWGSGAAYPDGSGIPYLGNEEDIFAGASFSGEADLSPRATGSCNGVAGCLNSVFDAALGCYMTASNNLAALSDNVATQIQYDAFMITCQDSTLSQYVVSVTGTQMTQFTYWTTTNCNFQAQWVINVRGTDNVPFSGDSFPAIPGGIVYNVIGSGRTITVDGTNLQGSLLAPQNTLDQTGGVINGKVVVGDVTMSLQINREGQCPAVVQVIIPQITDIEIQSGSNEYPCTTACPTGNIYTSTPNLNKRSADQVYAVTGYTANGVSVNPKFGTTYPVGSTFYTLLSSTQAGFPASTYTSSASQVVCGLLVVVAALLI